MTLYRVTIEVDTRDLDLESIPVECRFDDIYYPADELWKGQKPITYKEFFTALSKAAGESYELNKAKGIRRNWANEFSDDPSPRETTLRLFAKEFDCDLDELDEDINEVFERLHEIFSDVVCGRGHTIKSIVALPLVGEVVFYKCGY